MRSKGIISGTAHLPRLMRLPTTRMLAERAVDLLRRHPSLTARDPGADGRRDRRMIEYLHEGMGSNITTERLWMPGDES